MVEMSARAAKTQMKAFGIGGKTSFSTRSRLDKKRKPSPKKDVKEAAGVPSAKRALGTWRL